MKIILSVPTPCHEDWSAMTPEQDAATGISGRHCASCAHTVMDLTRVSDAQLIELFRKDAMPTCARFSQGQLDRVIALEEQTTRLLPAAAVGAALALATPDASAQNCMPTVGKMIARPTEVVEVKTVGELVAQPVDTTDEILQRVELGNVSIRVAPVVKGEMQVRETREEAVYYIDGVKVPSGAGPGLPISAIEDLPIITGGIPGTFGDQVATAMPAAIRVQGRVLDEQGQPAPFASLRVGNTALTSTTDAEGRFAFWLPDSLYRPDELLRVHAMGYASQEVLLWNATPAASTLDVPTYTPGRHALTGRVVHDGVPVAGCLLEVVGTDLRIRTDDKGFFGFDVPNGGHEWTVRAVALDGSSGSTTFPASALPCCIPVALQAQEPDAHVRPTAIDLGDIALLPREAIIMGMWIGPPVKRSLGSRFAQPFRWLGRTVARPFE